MKHYIDNSRFLELCCELASQVVEERFGASAFKEVSKDETKFTDEAQEFFNEHYDSMGTILNKVGKIFSDIDKPLDDGQI